MSTRIPVRDCLSGLSFLLMVRVGGQEFLRLCSGQVRPTQVHSFSFFVPRFCCLIKRETPAIAVSSAFPRDVITFACSSFVRFWLSLNLASILVTAISNPTMCFSMLSRYDWLRLAHCSA